MERDKGNRDLMHWQMGERMMRHPVATGLTALASAAVCGGVGTIHSMGMAAVILYPLQIYIIPKLQRQVNALGKQVWVATWSAEELSTDLRVRCFGHIHLSEGISSFRAERATRTAARAVSRPVEPCPQASYAPHW